MAPFLGSLPAPPNVVAVIGGRKALTDKFLRALHCAFGLHLSALPQEIWIGRAVTFGAILEALFILDPRAALRRIAIQPPWATFTVERFMGAGAPLGPAGAPVSVGDRVGVTLTLPRAGFVTLINADPVADGAIHYWLDPWLCEHGKAYQAGTVVLPDDGPLIPIGDPANVVSTLIAIVTTDPVTLEWPRPAKRHDCPVIDLPSMRRLAAEVLALPAPERSVSLFEYSVLPARVQAGPRP